MKLKGKGGIKGLFLLHGEKILLAVFGLGAAALAFFALKTERLPAEFSHEKLTSKVQTTDAKIRSSDWSTARRENADKVKIGDQMVMKTAAEVNSGVYDAGALNRSVMEMKRARIDPDLLAAAAVTARGGAARLAFNDEEAMRQQRLRDAQEQGAKERNATKQLEEEQGAGGRRGSRGTRRTRNPEEARSLDDPNHPNRRLIESGTARGGVTLEGGELIEYSRYVVVTAKVPLKEQRAVFRSAFDEALGEYNPERDEPVYLGYVVKRVELQPGEDPPPVNDPRWVTVPVYDAKGTPTRKLIQNAMLAAAAQELATLSNTEWALGNDEVVDPRFLDPHGILAYPLPPVVGRYWAADATHPEIPLAAQAVEDLTDEADQTAQPVAPTRGAGAGGEDFSIPTQGMSGSERSGRSTGRMEPRGAGRSAGGGRMGGDETAGRERNSSARSVPKTNAYLLRFFDFTVQPGKRYSYIVQMAVQDPNMGIKQAYLDLKVVDRLKALPRDAAGRPMMTYRRTDWSKPSSPTGVPLDGTVRMSGIQLAGDEPRAKLLVEAFGKEPKTGQWIEATPERDRDFGRGSVVNFQDAAEYVTGLYIDKTDNSFPFYTGITVIDMRGGERFPGRSEMTAPARVLVMEPTGELTLRRELDDETEVKAHRETFTKKRGGASARPGGGDPPPGRGR